MSFSKAAASRGVTQPAFSRRIRQLEQWLGVVLINRATFPARLTDEGIRFLPMAEETVRSLYRNRDDLRPPAAMTRDRIAFSALHTLTVTFLPGWLDKIRRQFPLFSSFVSPDKGGIEENVGTLVEGHCDFLLTYAHPSVPFLLDPASFPHLVLGTEKVMPVSVPHPDGPLLDRAVETQAPVSYIDYGDFSFFGMALNKLFSARPAFLRQTTHQNTISMGHKAMAMAGWGVSWLPESLVRDELSSGALVPASADPGWTLTVEIRLYCHADGARPTARRFWASARDWAERLGS